MDVKMKLSWKFLLLCGVPVWLLGKFLGDVVGSALSLIGLLMVIFGLIDLLRSFKERNRSK